MDELAVWQLPQPWHTFVVRIVGIEVLALHIFAALTPEIESGEVDLGVVPKAFADNQSIGLCSAGVFDQGGGLWPVAIVQRGFAQLRQDAGKRVSCTHGSP